MTLKCESCNGTSPRSYGPRKVTVRVLEGRQIVQHVIEAKRYRCKSCNTILRDGPPAFPDDVKKAIALFASQHGIRAASRWSGANEKTVRGYLSTWLADTGVTDTDQIPLALGIMKIAIPGQADAVILYDAETNILIDTLESVEHLKTWMEGNGEDVETVSLSIDPEIANIVSQRIPKAHLAVPPSQTRKALKATAQASIRALARGRQGNFKERENLALLEDAELSHDDADEIRHWAPQAKLIRRALLQLLGNFKNPAAFKKLAIRISRDLDSQIPESRMAIMLRQWKEAIINGVENSWIEEAYRDCKKLVAMIQGKRPAPIFEVISGVLKHLMANTEMRFASTEKKLNPAKAGYFPPVSTERKNLQDITQDLASFWKV